MNLRRTTGTAVLAATVGATLLTGCGSNGKPAASTTITGAATGKPTASAASSASASASAPGGPAAPTFNLPADVVIKTDGFTDTDPAKAEVLRDLNYEIQAWSEANAKGDSTLPVFKRYFTGLGAGAAEQNLKAFRASGKTVTGTDAFYRPTIALGDATSGGATYCEDQSQFYGKEISTGKVLTSTPSINDFVFWSVGLQKDSNGDWQVMRAQWRHGAEECKR